MTEVTVSRVAARRFLLESLELGANPSHLRTVAETVEALEAVQIDPVARVGRNQDLALLARRPRYRPAQLDLLLAQSEVFEYRANEASVLPMRDYPLFKGVRQRHLERLGPHLDRFPDTVRLVRQRIEAEGALPSRVFVSESRVMGYWDTESASTKETSHVLNLMADAGLLMVVRREGTTRYFDLPEQVLPPEIRDRNGQISEADADQGLFDKYFRGYRLVSGRHPRLGWSGGPMAARRRMLAERVSDGRVVAVAVEGVRGQYFVRAQDVEALQDASRSSRGWSRPIRFLPPLDNLLWDRDRLVDLFDFYYRWEVYVPAHKRTFGVYAMPILAGDRLVGRIDPELQRQESLLVIHNAQWESPQKATSSLHNAVYQALQDWAKRLGAEHVSWDGAFQGR